MVKEGIKAHVEVVQLDTTNDDQILEAVKFVENKYGKLDGMSVTSKMGLNFSNCPRSPYTGFSIARLFYNISFAKSPD